MKRLKRERLSLTQERLKEAFYYEPSTGIINRILPLNGSLKTRVGTVVKGGYIKIVVDKQSILAQDFIWLYTYGVIPNEVIYFKNGDRTDLRLSNLSIDPSDRPKYNKINISYEMYNNGVTQELVKKMFDYDPNTGIVTRKISRSGRGGKRGTIVNTLNDKGYLYVRLGARSLPLHRVIWLWWYGYWPEHNLDHIDRCRTNNRINNLREVSNQCNARNRCVRRTSKTGVTGVGWCNRQQEWSVNICPGKSEKRFLAYCEDFTEAVAHRLAAEQCLDWAGCDSSSSAYQYMQRYLKGEP